MLLVLLYLLMLVGAARCRELSLVDELLRQFTESLIDKQASNPSHQRYV